jgi:hypothetical protein
VLQLGLRGNPPQNAHATGIQPSYNAEYESRVSSQFGQRLSINTLSRDNAIIWQNSRNVGGEFGSDELRQTLPPSSGMVDRILYSMTSPPVSSNRWSPKDAARLQIQSKLLLRSLPGGTRKFNY